MSEPETDPEKKPLGKTLRTMQAVLRTGYDAETKHLLNVYAFHLNDKRPDWDVWSGQDSLSRESGLSVDTIARIQGFLLSEKVLVKRPPHALRKKKKEGKNRGGRPSRCFAINIEHLESLGYHDEKITQRDSRAKKRLQARQDRIRQRLMEADHGQALRDDLARTLREIRRRCPIVNGKRQTTDWYADYDRPSREAIKTLVLREPDLFARGTRHGDLVRKAYRRQARREEEQRTARPARAAEPSSGG